MGYNPTRSREDQFHSSNRANGLAFQQSVADETRGSHMACSEILRLGAHWHDFIIYWHENTLPKFGFFDYYPFIDAEGYRAWDR